MFSLMKCMLCAPMEKVTYSGPLFMMGTGNMIVVSKKLGIGAVISAETEVVSIGEMFPKCK